MQQNFSIGDLVKLNYDFNTKIGYGLVADIKEDLSDLKDYSFFNLKRDEIVDKLHILVYWTLRRKISEFNGYMWVYPSQISIVKKMKKEE